MIASRKPRAPRIDSAQHVRRKRPVVLCVDDDPNIMRSMELRMQDYQVKLVQSYFGMQGIWSAVQHQPEVIVTDLRMPQGNGDFMIECLKANAQTSHIPIVVLTGLPGNGLRHRMIHMGANGFLRKPVAFDDLMSELSRYVKLEKRSDAALT